MVRRNNTAHLALIRHLSPYRPFLRKNLVHMWLLVSSLVVAIGWSMYHGYHLNSFVTYGGLESHLMSIRQYHYKSASIVPSVWHQIAVLHQPLAALNLYIANHSITMRGYPQWVVPHHPESHLVSHVPPWIFYSSHPATSLLLCCTVYLVPSVSLHFCNAVRRVPPLERAMRPACHSRRSGK